MSKLFITNPDEVLVKSETRLTFGVEIEYLLARVDPEATDPWPKDPRQKNERVLQTVDFANEDICAKLEEAGISAAVEPSESNYSTLQDECYRKDWICKRDVSVDTEEPVDNAYWEHGMEIVSPPYYYDEGSKNAVQTVIKTLRNNYLVRVNGTTGLHVHVGNEWDGYSLPVLRNILAIAYTYERQFRLVLPNSRVNTTQGGDLWCRPFSYTRFGTQNPGLTRTEFLNHILSIETNNELVRDLSMTNRSAFNVLNLWIPYQSDKRTIEFRHHPGSLDPKAILSWVNLCIKLVEKGMLVKNQDEFVAHLRRDVEKSIGFGENEVSTIDFLMWLGCPAEAYYYGADMVTDPLKLAARIAEDERKHEEFIEDMKRCFEIFNRPPMPNFERDIG